MSYFLILGILELYTRKVCEMFVYKNTETIKLVKISLLFKKNTGFTRKLLQLRMRNFYYFYMNLNTWRDFQICISVPLTMLSV